MKYSLSNTINSSLHKVADKISVSEGTKQWTEGLQSIEQITGDYCDVGSIRKLHYIFNKKDLIITETIVEQNLPGQIKFKYESKMGSNIVELIFEEMSDNEVKQTSNTTMELKGVMRLFGGLMKGMFKKQSKKYMTAFKKYAEE
ncbi:SRPBCC family protein [Tenacibaculum xiamenense]|uniref:SRPBCC family protein n=1 Tax=Tenacibaculum xiamenense TaxID=1261553 RepID=UPI00389518AB